MDTPADTGARAIRRLASRLETIIRDSDSAGDIMTRFDEISLLLFVALSAASSGSPIPRDAEGMRRACLRLPGDMGVAAPPGGDVAGLDDAALSRCVDEIARTDLSGVSADVCGAAYEEVVRGTFDKSDNQQFFTPTRIIGFMASMVAATGGLHGVVCDPAAGTGGMLVGAAALSPGIEALGMDVDGRMAWTANVNLRLHGIPGTALVPGPYGSLGPDADRFDGTADVVLTNPPFGSDYSDPALLSRFELGRGRRSRRRAILFIERIHSLLRPGGIAAMVVDQGVLGSDGAADARAFIRSRFDVLAVVDLPPTAFMPYASVSTSILMLRRRASVPSPGASHPHVRTFMARAIRLGRRSNGDDRYVYGPDGTARVDSDLPGLLDRWRRFLASGTIAADDPDGDAGDGADGCGADDPHAPAAAYACDMDSEPFDNPTDRLDFDFHRPIRLESAAAIARCRMPMVPLGRLCSERRVSMVPATTADAPAMIEMTGMADIEPYTGAAHPGPVASASVKSAVLRYEPGDILFARMRPSVPKVALMDSAGWTSGECSVLVVGSGPDGRPVIEPELLAAFLLSDFVHGLVIPMTRGSSRPRIGSRDLLSIPIPLPPASVRARALERMGAERRRAAADHAAAERALARAAAASSEALRSCARAMLGE